MEKLSPNKSPKLPLDLHITPHILSLSATPSYVSRIHHRDSSEHTILGVQQVKPAELAQQMTLDVGNAWGVLHAIIDTCLELPVGKYLILKDPNKV